jgi:hypothetical protein
VAAYSPTDEADLLPSAIRKEKEEAGRAFSGKAPEICSLHFDLHACRLRVFRSRSRRRAADELQHRVRRPLPCHASLALNHPRVPDPISTPLQPAARRPHGLGEPTSGGGRIVPSKPPGGWIRGLLGFLAQITRVASPAHPRRDLGLGVEKVFISGGNSGGRPLIWRGLLETSCVSAFSSFSYSFVGDLTWRIGFPQRTME